MSPPYDANWTFFRLLRSSEAMKGRGVVVTTTHVGHLEEAAGEPTGAVEIIGKPYDLERVVAAVKSSLSGQNRQKTTNEGRQKTDA